MLEMVLRRGTKLKKLSTGSGKLVYPGALCVPTNPLIIRGWSQKGFLAWKNKAPNPPNFGPPQPLKKSLVGWEGMGIPVAPSEWKEIRVLINSKGNSNPSSPIGTGLIKKGLEKTHRAG